MKVYQLHKVQYLPIEVDEAWQFFSSAANLSKITPEDMGFKILTRLDGSPVHAGMRIDYIVRPVLRIPMRWTTEITRVEAPVRFTDKQLRGPYSLWEHTHTFEPVPGGVKMTDEVRYALPLGWLGVLAHWLFVKKRLDVIFRFREATLVRYFGAFKNS